MFKAHASGLGIAVRVTPKSSRSRIDGIAAEADGAETLKVAVTAPPGDGKANEAVIRLLAEEWRLPKNAFSIVTGGTSRRKTIMIQGNARVLETKIRDWLGQRHA